MAWMFSPLGIGIIVVLIVVIASLMYWKRKPIKRWLRCQEVDEVESRGLIVGRLGPKNGGKK